MKRYIIERELPGVGSMSGGELAEAAGTSKRALETLAPGVQWQHSSVASDRTFCVYLAQDEGITGAHAEASGFPASRIVEVPWIIDPVTAG